jgi:hypothetical protein
VPNYRASATLSAIGYGRIELPSLDTAVTVDMFPILKGDPGPQGDPGPAGPPGSGGSWGGITGTLSAQTDLQNALNAKASNSGATLTGATVNGVTLTNAGGTTNFLRADGTYAAPTVSTTSGTATLNFGAAPGSQEATVAVTGQAGILAGSPIRVWIQGESSADHNAYEHSRILAGRVGLAVESVSAGVGFTIVAASELQLTGQVSVRWQWG